MRVDAAGAVFRLVETRQTRRSSAQSQVAGDGQYEDASLADDKWKPSFVIEAVHGSFLPPKFPSISTTVL
jgi:hypothetical protein